MSEETVVAESILDEPEEITSITDPGDATSQPASGVSSSPDAAGQGGDAVQTGEATPYTLDIPEGFPIPEDNIKSFADACYKVGITRDQAAAVLNWHKEQYKFDQDFRAQQEQQERAGWKREILEDKTFGGLNYKTTVADARRGLAMIDPDGDLRQLLRASQGEWHPAVIRAAARLGRMVGEHQVIEQNGKTGAHTAEKPLWERMYGE